jgi:hypothetical protein
VFLSESQIRCEDVDSDKVAFISRQSKHPRSLVGNFNELEEDLKRAFLEVFSRSWVQSQVLVCMKGQNEGGYTQIEKRALREAVYGAGAREVFISEMQITKEQAIRAFKGEDLNKELKNA